MKVGQEFYDYSIRLKSPSFVNYQRNVGRPQFFDLDLKKKTHITKQLEELAGMFLLNTSSGGKRTFSNISGSRE